MLDRTLRVVGVTTSRAILRETRGAKSITADIPSFLRLAADIFLYRALRLGNFGLRNRERTIRFRNGLEIVYRLNRGDIQSIREVWLDQAYRLPCELKIGQVVDLGANIGLASLYFAKTYGASMIVAVEPNSANAMLVRRNLEKNGIKAHVIEAAIGPQDGVAHFSDAADSNLGAVSEKGREVRMLSIPTLCLEEGISSIDLLKMDIEGGEQALLTGPLGWIDSVQAIIAEFHPDRVDYEGLTGLIEENGFTWIKGGSVYPNTCDTFIRGEEKTN